MEANHHRVSFVVARRAERLERLYDFAQGSRCGFGRRAWRVAHGFVADAESTSPDEHHVWLV